jgi:threonine synthase
MSTGAQAQSTGVIRRFIDHLPIDTATPIITLGEGNTPLVHSTRLSQETGAEVWLKNEGLNPTGSFKDRGMTLAVSKAVQEGSKAVICASTGNTSASAAAYSGRAELTCGVLVPAGNVAAGKLAQALVHGATVVPVEGNFDVALQLVREVAKTHPVTLVNSVNPYRIEGQKTAAYEIVHCLGRAPDLHILPVGNAGNITAYWRGYREAREFGWSPTLPRMYGFQAQGASPIISGHPIEHPVTIATAIRIGNPASWAGALEAAGQSQGEIRAVSDAEILESYRGVAREGLFVEPASAASVAGLRSMSAAGLIPKGSVVVCTLTGHGLKDPDRALAEAPLEAPVRAELGPIMERLGLT